MSSSYQPSRFFLFLHLLLISQNLWISFSPTLSLFLLSLSLSLSLSALSLYSLMFVVKLSHVNELADNNPSFF